MIEKDNAIFMEPDEYAEYMQKKKEELNAALEQVRVENPEKIADTNMYELNKSIISQMKDLTNTEIKKRMKLIRSWLYNVPEVYYALICWDYHYITIFRFPDTNYDDQIKELQDILIDLGAIKAIDPHGMGRAIEIHQIEDHIKDVDAFEIWIQLPDDSEPKLFMLFPYGGGIVEV